MDTSATIAALNADDTIQDDPGKDPNNLILK